MATLFQLISFLLTLPIILISFDHLHAAALPHYNWLEETKAPLARTILQQSTSAILTFIPTAPPSPPSSIDETDARPLLEFKEGITQDPLGHLSTWQANTSHCQWWGVVCNSNSRVQSLTLPNEQLHGTISPALASLTFLVSLNLSSNFLSGSIPPQLGNSTSLLAQLILDHNNLTGTIPLTLSDCPVLYDIILNNNQLSGSIPSGLFRLPLLMNLDLSTNHLTGSLPSTSLTSSQFLTMIKLNNNRLSGSLPSALCTNAELKGLLLDNNRVDGDLSSLVNCSSLWILGVSFNNLQGTIPPEFGSFTNLQGLDLSYNQLSGQIPSMLGNCSGLVALALYRNQLMGSIPEELGSLTNLLVLALNLNKLSGVIPSSLGNCTGLIRLFLNNNQLTGPIPSALGQLQSLSEVRLFLNNLNGPFPTSLYNCTSLTTLALATNQLSGALLPEIRTLHSLRYLSINENGLTGSIPYEIGECRSLQILYLSGNKISGFIPDSIGSLTALQGLALAANSLVGPLPPMIHKLENLVSLSLSFNNLNGSIDALGLGESLSKLTTLFLRGNRFEGSIPEAIGNCENLTLFRLDNNEFTGTLPSSLGKLKYLIEFSSSENQLTGSIPAEIGSCSALRSLNLAYNKLDGSLPSSLGQLLSLSTALNLSRNSLSGLIPVELGSLQLLLSMDLSQNRFSGSIPNALGSCVMLQTLNLSSNNLTSAIPDSFSSLIGLESLDLSHNALNGSIPFSLSELPSLTHFNVSRNQLVGRIPNSPTFQNLTKESFLENPGLCGEILRKSCAQSSSKLVRMASIVGSISLIFIAFVVGLAICYTRRLENKHRPIGGELAKHIMMLTEDEIREATQGFSPENIIGSGGFSTVYKAKLQQEGQPTVAIKVLKFDQEQTSNMIVDKMFLSELNTMVELRHRNLVRVVGCCLGFETKAIILEHIPNGSLEKWLHSGTSPPLNWKQRVNIAKGIAQGLLYLHHEHDRLQHIVHCDLKPSNILLDEEMEPRIADFGIARILGDEDLQKSSSINSMTTSIFQGSIGYVAPEYRFHVKPNPKGDVYSYGVVLLELITGKRPNNEGFGEGVTLHAWTLAHLHNKDIEAYADPALMGSLRSCPTANEAEEARKQLETIARVGLMCASESADKRPTMLDVMEWIKSHIEEVANAPISDIYSRLAEDQDAVARAGAANNGEAFSQ